MHAQIEGMLFMRKQIDGVFAALNYQNGFRDSKEGKPRSFGSRLQTGSQREAYDKGYEDGLKQREAEGLTRISFDE